MEFLNTTRSTGLVHKLLLGACKLLPNGAPEGNVMREVMRGICAGYARAMFTRSFKFWDLSPPGGEMHPRAADGLKHTELSRDTVAGVRQGSRSHLTR